MKNNFYSESELKELGLKQYGENVLISKKCSIYGGANISLGSNVRIDDFCILSGDITIGNYVHISAFSALYGGSGIEIGNYCGLSPRSTIYSTSDDFSGDFMISPMVPAELTNVNKGRVVLNDFVQLGANTIIMPNITLLQGAVTGAFTFVNKDLCEWTINTGIPATCVKMRNRNILELVKNIK